MNSICERCGIRTPTLNCACQPALVALCSECAFKHFEELPGLPHSISIRRRLVTQDIKKLRQKEQEQMGAVATAISELSQQLQTLLGPVIDGWSREIEQHHSQFEQFIQQWESMRAIPKYFRNTVFYSLTYDISKLEAFQAAARDLFRLNLELPSTDSPSYFPVLRSNKIETFSLTTESAGRSVSISSENKINENSVYCLMPDERLFVCGGSWHAAAYFVNSWDGAVKNLPDMRQARAWHGLVNCKEEVMVFGGATGATSPISACEKLQLSTESWTSLHSMSVPRCGITPCELLGKVYIAGGGSNTLEVYNTANDTFTVAPVNLPGIKWTMCIASGQNLVVLGSEKVKMFDVQGGMNQVNIADHSYNSWYSACVPIQTPKAIYFFHPYKKSKELLKVTLSPFDVLRLETYNY